LQDRAEGEVFRISAGTSTQVTVNQKMIAPQQGVLHVSNANRHTVQFEVAIGSAGQKIEADGNALNMVDGVAVWSQMLDPGGSAELHYRF
jgi:hypothetical protein